MDHMRSWGHTADLSDKKLTLKVAMLLALANASRCSELYALDTQHMSWSEEGVTFTLAALTKTSRPGKEKTLFYPKLEADKQVCPVTTLKQYIERTNRVRKVSALFFSYVKPYGPVRTCTIERWLKESLSSAGFVDFKAHSTRGAAVTAAFTQGMSVRDIMVIADWSTDSMFHKYYYKADIRKPKSLTKSLV